ncbi:MAG: hypothetical protein E2O39_10675 [Planctomycetota bacterium]|nr:MAG: hypothetical protein E2O39_10675 [Planctomycetota bacterium]
MSLPILVAQDRWQDFDTAWQASVESEGPIDELVVALGLAGAKKRISRCLPQAKEHAALLEAGERYADAARVLGSALIAGGNPGELTTDLMRCAEAAWSEEPWWEAYRGLAGFEAGAADLRGPWRAFSKLFTYRLGTLVFHPGGWGAGEITGVRHEELELDVRFWNGKRDTFPMNAALEIFEPLAESDVRAMHFRDPEGLRKRAKKEPLEVMRAIVERHHGAATTALIRNILMQIGIEGSAWSAWWRKARKLAENSEWFEVSGSQQKSTVRLLLVAKDPAESLRKQLERAGGLHDVQARVRDLFTGTGVDERLRAVAVEMLDQYAENTEEEVAMRMAAWLLVAEQRGERAPAMQAVLDELMAAEVPTDPSVPPAIWKLAQDLATTRDQERYFALFKEILGDGWLDEIARHLQHAPPGYVRTPVEELRAAGRTEELLAHYAALLARPLRAPALLVNLADVFEKTELGEGFPTPAQRAQALLSLANNLFMNRRGNAQLARVASRLDTILAGGAKPILRRLLEDADVATVRSMHLLVQRGVDDAVDHLVTDIALELDRNFFAADSGPFWSTDTIWTTRSGLERRSAELKELREVKIPANQEAIGRAAAYGDLSENSEWEAAIEEQRTLTSRAMDMESEVKRADLLENAMLIEDTVCPGTIVRYLELESGKENTIRILGPWDAHLGPEVVSYMAPLAQGILGLHPEDDATVNLPAGELAVKVLSVEPAEIE